MIIDWIVLGLVIAIGSKVMLLENMVRHNTKLLEQVLERQQLLTTKPNTKVE